MYLYNVKRNNFFKLTKDGKTIAKYNGKKIVFSNTISEEEVKFFILKTSQYLKGCGAFKRFKFIEKLQDFEISK